jgi:hypothetical protein
MTRAEVVKYFDDYVERFYLPVHCGVEVFSVEKMDEEYLVRTSGGNYEAANVVIATGLYQAAKIPSLRIPSNILQIHSMDYKNPSSLPDGAVLVSLCAPLEQVPRLRDGYEQEQITRLNLNAAGVSTVIWATGYTFDFSMVKLPVVDSDGYPLQKRGVTRFEGLYFLGMPWLHNRRSGLLFGVGDDAAYLAAQIAAPYREHAKIGA